MLNRFQLMRRFFTSSGHLAAFLGVPVATLYDWESERNKPCRAALRLLSVLEMLEAHAPELHAVLVERSRPVKVERVKKPRKQRHKGFARAAVAWSDEVTTPRPVAASPVRPVVDSYTVLMDWPDDYWYPRTVTLAEFAAGIKPAIVDPVEMLRRMTDEQEQAYCDSLADFCRRTGRVIPDPEVEF